MSERFGTPLNQIIRTKSSFAKEGNKKKEICFCGVSPSSSSADGTDDPETDDSAPLAPVRTAGTPGHDRGAPEPSIMDKSHRTPRPAAMASSSAPSFVPLDADELLHRLFLGRLDEWHFQALALTVLDPRRLAPALESARERPDNLRGACETHEVAPWTADDLIGRWGFRSLSLAALITDQWLADREVRLNRPSLIFAS